jgi:hypothetical protein
VDDLAGSVHQTYGGLADPTYLIDVDGRVAFYQHWTSAPALHDALDGLERQGWRGVVFGGVERAPHFGAAMTDGWRGLRRGLPQSAIDLETSVPTSALGSWLGFKLKPVLAPLTLRSRPLPRAVRVAVAAAVLAPLALFVLLRRPRPNYQRVEPD